MLYVMITLRQFLIIAAQAGIDFERASEAQSRNPGGPNAGNGLPGQGKKLDGVTRRIGPRRESLAQRRYKAANAAFRCGGGVSRCGIKWAAVGLAEDNRERGWSYV